MTADHRPSTVAKSKAKTKTSAGMHQMVRTADHRPSTADRSNTEGKRKKEKGKTTEANPITF